MFHELLIVDLNGTGIALDATKKQLKVLDSLRAIVFASCGSSFERCDVDLVALTEVGEPDCVGQSRSRDPTWQDV